MVKDILMGLNFLNTRWHLYGETAHATFMANLCHYRFNAVVIYCLYSDLLGG